MGSGGSSRRSASYAGVTSGEVPSDSGVPTIGGRVRICGLQSKPELNGLEGVCKAFVADTGRYVVVIDADGREISAKPQNIVPIGGSGLGSASNHPCGCSSSVDVSEDAGARPMCQKLCGRQVPLAAKPSGFPYDTCCKGCHGGLEHDERCQEGVVEHGAETQAGPLSADEQCIQAALLLFKASKGDSRLLGPRELDVAARVVKDRLCSWPHSLRCFSLQAVTFRELSDVGAVGCPWIAHLEPFYVKLGSSTFQLVCKAHAQVLDGFWRQKGARILDRGLKAGDSLQVHALEIVSSVWGSIIDRGHSQEYLDRGTARILHSGTLSEYTPPSCGRISSSYWTQDMGLTEQQASADIDRVVRISLLNDKAQFDDTHVPLYHGLAAKGFSGWAKSGAAFKAYPGKFGDGVYLTPSFQMACMYAFREPRTLAALKEGNLAKPRFAATPDGRWNYLMCFQVMAEARAVEKFSGTAFTDAGDGWNLEAQISIVRKAAQAQIYGILFCYFPRTFQE